jgi:hypothetical protein
VVAIALASGGKVLVSEDRKRILRLCGYWNNVDDLVLNEKSDFTGMLKNNKNKKSNMVVGGGVSVSGDKEEEVNVSDVSNDLNLFTTDPTDPSITVVIAKSTNHEAMKELLLSLPQVQRDKFDTV